MPTVKPENRPSKIRNHKWLMDLSQPLAVFTVVVITQMVVLVYSLSFLNLSFSYLNQLAVLSFVAQLLAISLVLLLVLFRERLNQLPAMSGVVLVLILTIVVTTFFTAFLLWVDRVLMFHYVTDGLLTIVKVVVATVLTMVLLLRYFYVQNQWQQQIKALAEAQMSAFQARIKPHFLYNSLNSIAGLIAIDPPAAEQAVMDLSGLFRKAFTQRSQNMTSLEKELAWVNQYLAIERLRLAERLQYQQQVDGRLLKQSIPLLTIQPLIENAVIHGIAHLAEGGCINLDITKQNDSMRISVRNPFTPDRVKSGSGTALANIKARLALHYGNQASLTTDHNDGCFQVLVMIPL
ncbi:sensor histidine kinase [Marinicella gelatinilytica]|uniref:sensor histidine kinase n=1 Tax=Marinicella gelatinilytica TaxID=2996017 RepID=UPI0022608D77|nr:sensor histidine kinase [Marinicella gelatinilytica]MCX7544928.1 sensor histidine kinase [Marinicella gelatinilytica]